MATNKNVAISVSAVLLRHALIAMLARHAKSVVIVAPAPFYNISG
jgi:hypothetical protein